MGADRVLQTLTSTTPRSDRDDDATVHGCLYAEAKERLANGDVRAAQTLLAACPDTYRRVEQYRTQCETLERLRAEGVVVTRASDAMRDALADILPPQRDRLAIARYAERLCDAGFSVDSVRTCTAAHVDDLVDAAGMSEGHRLSVRVHADAQTPWLELWFHRLTRAAGRCAGVARLVRLAQPPRRMEEDEEN